MKKAFLYGVMASFFFAFTHILNRSMQLGGGYWMWSASLRYLSSLPFLAVLVWREKGFRRLFGEIADNFAPWFLWSNVGFGLFYAPLTFAAQFGTSWFVSATLQIMIVTGVLMSPLFGQKTPWKNLGMSLLVLAGVLLLQTSAVLKDSGAVVSGGGALAFFPILLAAFCYPLGNRMMMIICPPEITTPQRVFGMTLCSTPLWLVLSGIAWIRSGPPSASQIIQSAAVGFFVSVIATVLFFRATTMVRKNPRQLALIEATQCGDLVFSTLGGIVLLKDPLPSALGFFGILLILGGMLGGSLVTVIKERASEPAVIE